MANAYASRWTAMARRAGVAPGPVVIEVCHIQRGWDACDHLIDDAPADALRGTRHPTLFAAVRAADAVEGRHSCACFVTIRDRHGRRWALDTSPDVPGRAVRRVAPVESRS